MKVAAIQMVSGTGLDDNLRVARELLEQAALILRSRLWCLV